MCAICKTIRGGGAISIDGKRYQAKNRNQIPAVIDQVRNASFMQCGDFQMLFEPYDAPAYTMEAEPQPTEYLTMH